MQDQESSRPPMIVLAGNIATGKSTLAGLIAQRLEFELVEESVGDNPFLPRFYSNMSQWAFHLNMYFLAARSHALMAAKASGRATVFDRSLHEDRLFVDQAYDDGITPGENYNVFCELHDVLIRLLPAPTLLVYLEASTNTLERRIAARGRQFEQGVDAEYLDRLQRRYQKFIDEYRSSPVIRINVDAIDVATIKGLDDLCVQIRTKIATISNFHES